MVFFIAFVGSLFENDRSEHPLLSNIQFTTGTRRAVTLFAQNTIQPLTPAVAVAVAADPRTATTCRKCFSTSTTSRAAWSAYPM